MLKLLLLSTFRNLWRSKLVSLISIGSMFIGLAIFSLALLYVKREAGYNQSWPDADRIHRMYAQATGVPGLPDNETDGMLGSVYGLVKGYFTEELAAISRVVSSPANVKDADKGFSRSLAFVDADYMRIFQYEVVQGSMENALSGPRRIAISEQFADSLGDSAGIGESLMLSGFAGAEMEFEIAAIYRNPERLSPSVDFDSISLIDDSAIPFFSSVDGQMRFATWESQNRVWIKLKPGFSTAAFNAAQPAFIDQEVVVLRDLVGRDNKVSDFLEYHWQPIREMHLNPLQSDSTYSFGDKGRVLIFGVVGLLVLLVACSNSISLSLSSVIMRQREIGIRKASGAGRGDIITQYLAESVLLAMLSLLPVLAILELGPELIFNLAPAVFSNRIVRLEVTDYLQLGSIALLVGLINGLYPACVLSGHKPQTMLSQNAGGKSMWNLRNVLLLGQFCFAATLLISTASLYVQLSYTRAQPLGFSVDNVLVAGKGIENAMQPTPALPDALRQIPGVLSVVPVSISPGGNLPRNMGGIKLLVKGEETIETEALSTGVITGFFEHFEMLLIAGRMFDAGRDTVDWESRQLADGTSQSNGNRVLLNRRAVKELGFASPEAALDQRIFQTSLRQNASVSEQALIVVGVVEDSMMLSLKYLPRPQVFSFVGHEGGGNISIKYQDSVEGDIQERVRAVWQESTGFAPGSMRFLEESLKTAFTREEGESRLLLICGALAFFLSCIGLFGLASFTMGRSLKEVGVRKVLGSDVSALTGMFLWRFSKPVLLANVLAIPVAMYFVLQWIEQFPYQLEKIWLLPIALGTAAAVLLVSLLTVGWITYRAASQRPVLALRYE